MSAKHENIRDEVNEQKKKFASMSGKEKWQYFLDYYKVPALVLAAVLILGAIFIRDMIIGSKESLLSAGMINGYPQVESEAFMAEFAEYAGIDLKEYQVTMDTTMQYSKDGMSQMSMATVQKLMTLVSTNSIDVILTDREALENYASSGFFADLRTVLPPELIEKYQDSFYYYTFDSTIVEEGVEREEGYQGAYDTLEPVPVAIMASSFPRLQSTGAYDYETSDGKEAEPFFAICSTSHYMDNAIKFLEFLDS